MIEAEYAHGTRRFQPFLTVLYNIQLLYGCFYLVYIYSCIYSWDEQPLRSTLSTQGLTPSLNGLAFTLHIAQQCF